MSEQTTSRAIDQEALNEEASKELEAMVAAEEAAQGAAVATGAETDDAPHALQNMAERKAVIEALIFVSEEPLSAKAIADVLKEENREVVEEALTELVNEFNARNGGLQLREVAGGWQFATRPEYHEHVRAF